MKCLDDGHIYELENFYIDHTPGIEARYEKPRILYFYEMKEDGTKINGVTNEEVLRVLIHRLEALNKKNVCFENVQAITSLRGALSWLEARTENRVKRNVEGTHKP